MAGEPGWNTDPATRAVLLHVDSIGYVVSVHRPAASRLGTMPASVEMHAVRSGAPPEIHVASIVEGDDHVCACLLAEMAGIDLKY